MRRLVAAIVTALASLALLGPLAGAGTGQSAGRLTLVEKGVFLYLPQDDPDSTPRKVFAPRAGERYRFQVDYEVGGNDKIATGHTFVYSNAVTGEQLKVSTKAFPLGDPGSFNESLTFTIPESWAPGIYRFSYTVTARAPGFRNVAIRGTRTFLLLRGTSDPA